LLLQCDFQPDLAAGTKRYYMTDPESVAYISAAIAALAETGRVDSAKIAVLGMCQTGRHPIVMGAASDAIAAAICWYGAGSTANSRPVPIIPRRSPTASLSCAAPSSACSVGETDTHIPIRNVRRLRALFEQHGKSFDIALYEGAPHGFLNDTMPERYRPRPIRSRLAAPDGLPREGLLRRLRCGAGRAALRRRSGRGD